MKKSFCLLGVLFVLSLSVHAQAGEAGINTEKRGNTTGNLANEGRIAIHNGWIYYYDNNGKFYRENEGNGTKELLAQGGADSLNAMDDALYFRHMMSPAKLDYETKEITYLLDGDRDRIVHFVYVVDGYIYYNEYKDTVYHKNNTYTPCDNILYRMRLNGTGKETIVGNLNPACINITGGYIYYITNDYSTKEIKYAAQQDPRDRGRLHKITLDGKKDITLADSARTAVVHGDYVYFLGNTDKTRHTVCRVKTDGSGKTELFKSPYELYGLNVTDKYIYSNIHSSGLLCRVKIDGTDFEIVADFQRHGYNVAGLNIFNNKLYYIEEQDNIVAEYGKTYAIDLDGKNKRALFTKNMQQAGDNIYYMSLDDDGKFYWYKMDMDGSNIVKIAPADRMNNAINAEYIIRPNEIVSRDGNYLYYTDSTSFVRQPVSGGKQERLLTGLYCQIGGMTDKYAYVSVYNNTDYRYETYRVSLDGTEENILIDIVEYRSWLSVLNDTLYFTGYYQLENGDLTTVIYKAKSDGTDVSVLEKASELDEPVVVPEATDWEGGTIEEVTLTHGICDDLTVGDDGYLYYMMFADKDYLCRIKDDGSEREIISADKDILAFQVSNGYIYYVEGRMMRGDDYETIYTSANLCKMRTDGTDHQLMKGDDGENIEIPLEWYGYHFAYKVLGDHIYYFTEDKFDRNSIFRLKTFDLE